MVLRIDPRYPLVWRDPTALQFGVTKPVATLADVSPAAERMIAALLVGISPSGLTMTGTSAGATADEVDDILDALLPALERATPKRPKPVVLVVGSGAIAHWIAETLRGGDVRVVAVADATPAQAGNCAIAVIVADYVVPPHLHGTWLRRDIPHLPVIASDTDVTIGPIVEPGAGPCLHCILRHRTDADAAWPAIATQASSLARPPLPTLAIVEAAALAARLVRERVDGAAASAHRSIAIDSDTGLRSYTDWTAHPECGCSGFDDPLVSAALRRGSGSPVAGRRESTMPHSTRETVSTARE